MYQIKKMHGGCIYTVPRCLPKVEALLTEHLAYDHTVLCTGWSSPSIIHNTELLINKEVNKLIGNLT